MPKIKWYRHALATWIVGWASLFQAIIDIPTLGLLYGKTHLCLDFAWWCAKHVYRNK